MATDEHKFRPSVAPGENAALTYQRLRGLIGLVGLVLPASLLIRSAFAGHLESSMSAYYYTDMNVMFSGSMCVLGVFLLAYRFGAVAWENLATTLAGIAALGVAFFHTTPPNPSSSQQVFGLIHLGCAITLFVLLGAISALIFPIDVPRGRWWESAIYRLLGLGIWAFLILMPVLQARLGSAKFNDQRVFFWLEVACSVCFSVSFLLKGRFERRRHHLSFQRPLSGRSHASGDRVPER